jgi:hypothetical protein
MRPADFLISELIDNSPNLATTPSYVVSPPSPPPCLAGSSLLDMMTLSARFGILRVVKRLDRLLVTITASVAWV